ncbi:MAG TPA: alpha/beta hydrolase [Vicinamibacterales bacterium]|nr:alpha/beta hydrolase [Vicinamibacterales bacterium]
MTPLLLGLRRAVGLFAALLAFLVLAGTTYQGVATALERHRLPRPGGLVDAGGHQLHIYCTGEGSPVVVLEAGTGSMSAAWGWVQPEIARSTRVCSYDRAGLGWSEAGDGSYIPSRVPEELRVLLDRSNETGPIVLVGHELGALYARMYAARFARDTAALVLIDDPVTGHSSVAPVFPSAWPWLARVGVLRLSGRLSSLASGLPGASADAMRAFLNRPDHLTRAAMELSQFDQVEGTARALTLSPQIIVTDVTIGSAAQPAMLVTRDDAGKVMQAIEATVEQVRKSEVSARFE